MLLSFSLLLIPLSFIANAEILADAVLLDAQYTSAYYKSSNGAVSEKYITVKSYGKAALGSDLQIYYDYPSASENVTFLTLKFSFPSSDLMLGQSYNLSFTSNWLSAYTYSYGYFFEESPLLVMAAGVDTIDYCKVIGSTNITPNQFNSYFLNKLSTAGINNNLAPFNGRVTEQTPFSVDITIPADYRDYSSDGSVPYATFYYYLIIHCNSLYSDYIMQNIKLTPIGETAFLYEDQQFQDDVIGSDDTGGLKGIFKQLKELPNKFSGFITNLGDRIGQFFTQLKDNLINGIKDLFVPDEQFMTDYSDTWKSLLSDRLGAVYQVINVIDESWKTIRQSDLQDSIELPVVNIPLPEDNEFSFGGYTVRVVPEGFEFLGTTIKTVTSMVLVIMFIQGLRRKYDEVITK